MAAGNQKDQILFILWVVCFANLILMSFFIFVPIAMTMDDTDGNCFLYADVFGYGAVSTCNFCVALAVILLLICGARIALLIKISTFKELSNPFTDTKVPSSFNLISVWGLHSLVYVLDLVLTLLLLITASLISAGLSHMCNALFDGRSECSSEYGVALPDLSVNTSFYQKLTFAEGSVWFTFLFWLIVVAFETYMMWKTGYIVEIKSRARTLFNKDSAPASA